MPSDTFRPGRDRTLASWEDLVEVLCAQHQELRFALSRLPHLSGAARADEFLQVRRRLAVHEALEAELVRARLSGRATPDPADVHEEVVAAEALGTDSAGFDEAVARLLAGQLRHAEVQEEATFGLLSGQLTPPERAVARTGVSLWAGEGEAYLGNEYADMVATARQQLADAPEPGHAPPV